MIAHKFLAKGAVGPFTRFRWPVPAAGLAAPWVEAPDGAPEDLWIHACRVADLPYWLGAELWRIELDDPVRPAPHQVASPRGRLVARIAGWDAALGAEFGSDCAFRARDMALPRLAPGERDALLGASDLASLAAACSRAEGDAPGYVHTAAVTATAGRPAVAGFAAEMLARWLGGDAAGDAERARQARWLAERLRLSEG